MAALAVGACGGSDGDGGTTTNPASSGSAVSSTSSSAPGTTSASSTIPTTGTTGTTGTTARSFDVYLLTSGEDCSAVVAATRNAPGAPGPFEALTALLAGPTADEERAGRRSWFSAATAGLAVTVKIEGRLADVSFDPRLRTIIPNASSSCGSAGLLAQLDATVLQFDGIDRVIYAFDGDTGAFYEWLQYATPQR